MLSKASQSGKYELGLLLRLRLFFFLTPGRVFALEKQKMDGRQKKKKLSSSLTTHSKFKNYPTNENRRKKNQVVDRKMKLQAQLVHKVLVPV